MELKGIDVSKYQATIDWNKVKNSGIDFAIIRIGYGKNDNQKDEYFDKNYDGAKKAGIKVGIYLYSYAVNIQDAKNEANNLLSWLNSRTLDLPIYYDIEDNSQSNLSRQTLTEICTAFAEIVEKAGYWVRNIF